MTFAIATALCLIVMLIAVLHAYWGLGGTWPASDQRGLARMVVGAKDIERMPGQVPCFIVAVLLLLIAIWPFILIGSLPEPWPRWLTLAAGGGIALVFLGRGIMSFIPALRFLGPEEPFATLDKRFYAPLCLLLGLLVLLLLIRSW